MTEEASNSGVGGWVSSALILYAVVWVLGFVFMIFWTVIKVGIWFILHGKYEMSHSSEDRPYAFTISKAIFTPYFSPLMGGAGATLISVVIFVANIPNPDSPAWNPGTAFVLSAPATVGLPFMFYGLVNELNMLFNYNGWVKSYYGK